MKKIKKIGLFAVGDHGWQGGIQYITNIINALNNISAQHEIDIHLLKHSGQQFRLDAFRNLKIKIEDTETIFPEWSISNRVFWFAQRKFMHRTYPRVENYFIKNSFDYIYPSNLSDCSGKLNAASWIADFQYHHFPEGASKAVTASAKKTISGIVENSKKIVLSSKYCEKDCFELFPASKGKTHVMPFSVFIDEKTFGFRDFDQLINKYQLPQKFLMVANLFAPTKNHQTLFNAMGILKKKGIIIELVCTGNIVDYRNQLFANEILQMLTDNKIRNQVQLLGLIPRNEQIQLYRMATALVQPSVNEGWNTSVEEAKALGKTLILSNIEVHKEQCPLNNNFFNSLDAEDLAKVIERVWASSKSQTFPDTNEEYSAFTAYQKEVKKFGERFMEIAAF